MQLTITGYSTALFSTWYFIEEWGICFDATKLHSTLDEVMEMVTSIRIGQLIPGHFSSRYSPEEIDAAIRDRCSTYAISFPVYRVLPGETVLDILGGSPSTASRLPSFFSVMPRFQHQAFLYCARAAGSNWTL